MTIVRRTRQRVRWQPWMTTVALIVGWAMFVFLLSGCSYDPNADIDTQLSTAGSSIKAWQTPARAIAYGLIGLGWLAYIGIYGLSILGVDSLWNKHQDWWRKAAVITFFVPAILETVLAVS